MTGFQKMEHHKRKRILLLLLIVASPLHAQADAETEKKSCTDNEGKVIPHGTDFTPNYEEPCQKCICDDGYTTLCRTAACSPPPNCDEKKAIPRECCKFDCGPGHDSNPPFTRHNNTDDGGAVAEEDNITNLSLRLVASTVTSFLVLALLLFMVHRLRQRRLMMAMRRFEARARQDGAEDEADHYIPASFLHIQCPPYEDPPPPYSPPKPPHILPTDSPPPYREVENDTASDVDSNGNVSNNNNNNDQSCQQHGPPSTPTNDQLPPPPNHNAGPHGSQVANTEGRSMDPRGQGTSGGRESSSQDGTEMTVMSRSHPQHYDRNIMGFHHDYTLFPASGTRTSAYIEQDPRGCEETGARVTRGEERGGGRRNGRSCSFSFASPPEEDTMLSGIVLSPMSHSYHANTTTTTDSGVQTQGSYTASLSRHRARGGQADGRRGSGERGGERGGELRMVTKPWSKCDVSVQHSHQLLQEELRRNLSRPHRDCQSNVAPPSMTNSSSLSRPPRDCQTNVALPSTANSSDLSRPPRDCQSHIAPPSSVGASNVPRPTKDCQSHISPPPMASSSNLPRPPRDGQSHVALPPTLSATNLPSSPRHSQSHVSPPLAARNVSHSAPSRDCHSNVTPPSVCANNFSRPSRDCQLHVAPLPTPVSDLSRSAPPRDRESQHGIHSASSVISKASHTNSSSNNSSACVSSDTTKSSHVNASSRRGQVSSEESHSIVKDSTTGRSSNKASPLCDSPTWGQEAEAATREAGPLPRSQSITSAFSVCSETGEVHVKKGSTGVEGNIPGGSNGLGHSSVLGTSSVLSNDSQYPNQTSFKSSPPPVPSIIDRRSSYDAPSSLPDYMFPSHTPLLPAESCVGSLEGHGGRSKFPNTVSVASRRPVPSLASQELRTSGGPASRSQPGKPKHKKAHQAPQEKKSGKGKKEKSKGGRKGEPEGSHRRHDISSKPGASQLVPEVEDWGQPGRSQLPKLGEVVRGRLSANPSSVKQYGFVDQCPTSDAVHAASDPHRDLDLDWRCDTGGGGPFSSPAPYHALPNRAHLPNPSHSSTNPPHHSSSNHRRQTSHGDRPHPNLPVNRPKAKSRPLSSGLVVEPGRDPCDSTTATPPNSLARRRAKTLHLKKLRQSYPAPDGERKAACLDLGLVEPSQDGDRTVGVGGDVPSFPLPPKRHAAGEKVDLGSDYPSVLEGKMSSYV